MKKIFFAALLALSSFCGVYAQAQKDELTKIIEGLKPYVQAEIAGTPSGEIIDKFYKSDDFKKAAFKQWEFKAADISIGHMAEWKQKDNIIVFSKAAVEDFIKHTLKVPVKNFSANKDYMSRLAVCAAPVYVHETRHKIESASLRAIGIKEVFTMESEFAAYLEEYLFMSDKQLAKDKNYYSGCGFINEMAASVDRDGAASLLRHINNIYSKTIMPPFNKDYIIQFAASLMKSYGQDEKKLESAREADAARELLKLGVIKPGDKVLITLDDYFKNGTGRYNWNRIALKELDAAYRGENELFNKYTKWFEGQLSSLYKRFDAARKKKQLAKMISEAERGEAAPPLLPAFNIT